MHDIQKALSDSKRLIAIYHQTFEVTIKTLRQKSKIIRQSRVAIKRDPEGK
jgi:hypothetical protein